MKNYGKYKLRWICIHEPTTQKAVEVLGACTPVCLPHRRTGSQSPTSLMTAPRSLPNPPPFTLKPAPYTLHPTTGKRVLPSTKPNNQHGSFPHQSRNSEFRASDMRFRISDIRCLNFGLSVSRAVTKVAIWELWD